MGNASIINTTTKEGVPINYLLLPEAGVLLPYEGLIIGSHVRGVGLPHVSDREQAQRRQA